MKTIIKTDFEKWFIKQLTKEDKKYYFMVGAKKVYVFFEGQKTTISDDYVTIQIHAEPTRRISTGAKYHTGVYKFFIYGKMILTPDKVTDALATILDEVAIEETPGAKIETGILSTLQRGNKFAESTHYENITEITFHHWSA